MVTITALTSELLCICSLGFKYSLKNCDNFILIFCLEYVCFFKYYIVTFNLTVNILTNQPKDMWLLKYHIICLYPIYFTDVVTNKRS